MNKKLDKYIVSIDGIINDAILSINKNKSRCVIVIDKNYKVYGVFSEGDLLRFLIAGMNIYSPIKSNININFKYLNNKNKKKALDLVKCFGITLIPVVDEEMILKDIISIHDLLMDI